MLIESWKSYSCCYMLEYISFFAMKISNTKFPVSTLLSNYG